MEAEKGTPAELSEISFPPKEELRRSGRGKGRAGRIIFGIFFTLLLAASVLIILYYLQVSEPLNRRVDRYLGRGTDTAIPPRARHPAPGPPSPPQTDAAPAVPYDYYLQIAAWPGYDQAEKSRDGFVRRNIPAIVRRGFNARRRTAFYRVWLGPFPTASAAAALKKRGDALIPADAFVDSILRSGSAPSLPPGATAPATTAPATAAPNAAIPPAGGKREESKGAVPPGYYIVIASLQSRAEAEKEAARLKKKGLAALVQDWQGRGAVWYRVQAGPFPTDAAARTELRSRRALYGEEAFVSSRGR